MQRNLKRAAIIALFFCIAPLIGYGSGWIFSNVPPFDPVADKTKVLTINSSGMPGWLAGSTIAGPTSSTNNDLVAFSGTGGTTLQDSGILGANVVQTSRQIIAGTGITVTPQQQLTSDITVSTTALLKTGGTLTGALTTSNGSIVMTGGANANGITIPTGGASAAFYFRLADGTVLWDFSGTPDDVSNAGGYMNFGTSPRFHNGFVTGSVTMFPSNALNMNQSDVQVIRSIDFGTPAGVTAHAGGGQGSATTVCGNNIQTLVPVTTVGSAGDSLVLAAFTGRWCIIKNTTGTSANLFPPSGGQICMHNASCLTTNTAQPLAANNEIQCWGQSATIWNCR